MDTREELRRLLQTAGALALERFGRVGVERKEDGSVVTEADRVCEEVLVEGLARSFPNDRIESEEGALVEGRPGGARWLVDPIDGTSAFVGGLAYWGPTVCRVVDGRLQVGAFYVPRLGEHWYAAVGEGAWRDDRRLQPIPPDRVSSQDVLFVPSRFHRRGPAPWPGKVRALGSSAAHLAHVAAGGGLGAIVPGWHLWDVGCGVLLAREAGLVVWDPSGTDTSPELVPAGSPLLVGAPIALRALIDGGWARSALERKAVAG